MGPPHSVADRDGMNARHERSSRRPSARRERTPRDRGAAIVEYMVIAALISLVSLKGIEYVGDTATHGMERSLNDIGTVEVVDDGGDCEGAGNGKGNPAVGNPGNDKCVGNAGEDPSDTSNPGNGGGNGNGGGDGGGNGRGSRGNGNGNGGGEQVETGWSDPQVSTTGSGLNWRWHVSSELTLSDDSGQALTDGRVRIRVTTTTAWSSDRTTDWFEIGSDGRVVVEAESLEWFDRTVQITVVEVDADGWDGNRPSAITAQRP